MSLPDLASRAVQKLTQPHRPKPVKLHPFEIYRDENAPEPARDGVTSQTLTPEQRDAAAGRLSEAALAGTRALANVVPPRVTAPPRGLPREQS